MKTSHLWLTALCASTLLFSTPLQAFDNAPEETTPELALAFPFGQSGETVMTTEDILINPGCVIPANSTFLTIFVPPKAEDVDVKIKAKKSDQDVNYSRNTRLPAKKDELNPAQKAAFDRATRAPWKSQMLFRAAMKQFRFDEMRLVFVTPGAETASLEAFDLPEGMLLGGAGGVIKILAIQKDSDSSRAGLKAGTTILKVNDKAITGGLMEFQKVYYAEKKAAHEAGKSVEVTVKVPESAEPKTVAFLAPRKLELTDFFSASDVAKDPDKKPAPAPTPDRTNPSPMAP